MNDYERNKRRLNMLEPALVAPGRIRNARALQHLKEGFNRRVLMLDASYRFLLRKAGQVGGKPMSPYMATDLAIHLNAFYLNVCGSLDNLAWALQYEHQLVPGADEVGRKRLQINLFAKLFLEALEKSAPSLASTIRKYESWNTDLKALRDPAAHRIPVYAIPGVVDQQQGEEFKRLQTDAARLFESGDHEGGTELMFKSQNVGTYQPLMSLSHESRFEVRGIVPQVRQDDENLITVSEAVLQNLFPSPSQQRRS